MSVARIVSLLNQRIGLDAESIGAAAVARAVDARCTACGLAGAEQYWERLHQSAEEIQALIEAVVVPETWFFRHREAFAALTRVALAEWQRRAPAASMRLLSLPCASGEEPYSMAMALLDTGLPAARFSIDALDISQRALAQAQAAQYGRNAFRGTDLAFRDRYFETSARGFRPAEAVRRQVRFHHANLFDGAALAGLPAYDVIFCRNLLIYCDHHARRAAVQRLAQLLAPSGLLFVGPSEGVLLLDQGFVSAGVPLAFAFRRAGAAAPKRPCAQPSAAVSAEAARRAAAARAVAARSVSAPLAPVSSAPVPVPAPSAAEQRPASAQPAPQPAWIDAAQRLADEGRLAEALALCERHLPDSPSAQGFYLAALIHDAGGRHAQALDCYRKALYLDPAHEEALVHLGTALASDGEAGRAQRLFARAGRVRDAGRR
jgi:chemotaxis protein methyltransferase WspC